MEDDQQLWISSEVLQLCTRYLFFCSPVMVRDPRRGFCPYAQVCPVQAPNKSHCKVKEKITCLPGLAPFKYSSLYQLFFVNFVKLSGFTGEIQEQPSQVENPREHLGQKACVCCCALKAQGWEGAESTWWAVDGLKVFIRFPSYSFLQWITKEVHAAVRGKHVCASSFISFSQTLEIFETSPAILDFI